MANAKRFKKGSRTRDKGWTHCSVSASNIEGTAKVVGSNSEGSTIMLSAVAAGLIVGTTTKADADTVREATRSKIRVIIMANKGEKFKSDSPSEGVGNDDGRQEDGTCAVVGRSLGLESEYQLSDVSVSFF